MMRAELRLLIHIWIPTPGQVFASCRTKILLTLESCAGCVKNSWIVLDLSVGSMWLQLLALQRCHLIFSLCITSQTSAANKSIWIFSCDIDSLNALFIFRPALASCQGVLWCAWSGWTTCDFSGQFWSTVNFRTSLSHFPAPLLASFSKDCCRV